MRKIYLSFVFFLLVPFLLTNDAHSQFTTFERLGTLIPFGDSSASQVSLDGQTVMGTAMDGIALGSRSTFIWTAVGGMASIGNLPNCQVNNAAPTAAGLNVDGTIAVGNCSAPTAPSLVPFLWTSPTGLIDISTVFGQGQPVEDISAFNLSIIGSVAVGSTTQGAFLNLNSGAFNAIGSLTGPTGSSRAIAVSPEGSVVVGTSISSGSSVQAIRYDAVTQVMTPLMYSGGTTSFSEATDVSFLGQVIVGRLNAASGRQEAFYWTAATGMVAMGVLDSDTSSTATAVSGGRKMDRWHVNEQLRPRLPITALSF